MNCSTERNDPKIAVSEKGRTFRLENPNRRTVTQVKVDGCLITGERERCDYLFVVPHQTTPPTHRVCYVELKGKHIEKAISQIIATMEFTKAQYIGFGKEAYIVSSRVPAENPATQAGRIKLRKEYKASLLVRSSELSVSVP